MGVATLVFSVAATAAAIAFGFIAWRYAARAERRSTETHDIVWVYEPMDDGFAFAHNGTCSASKVFVSLTVNSVASTAAAERLPRNTWLPVPNVGYVQHHEFEENADANYSDALVDYYRLRNSQSGLPTDPPIARPVRSPVAVASVRAVIVWTYPSGASDRQELSWTA